MRRLATFALAAPLLALAACGDDATAPSVPPLAFVRYVHAVPDTGAVIVRLTNGPVENFNGGISVAYRGVTPWSGIAAGTRSISVFPQTTNINLAPNALTEGTFAFQANRYYTLLHTGLGGRCLGHANVPAGQSVADRLYVIEEPMIPETGGGLGLNGNFGLRVLLASPGFPNPQTIYLTRDATAGSLANPVVPAFAAMGPPATGADGQTSIAGDWRTMATGALVLRSYTTGATLVDANRLVQSTVTAGGAQFNTSVSAPPGSNTANSAMTAFIFAPALDGGCSPTGGVQVTYAADVRAPVPQ